MENKKIIENLQREIFKQRNEIDYLSTLNKDKNAFLFGFGLIIIVLIYTIVYILWSNKCYL